MDTGRPKETNKDKIDTSMDTSAIFPPTLINRKLHRRESRTNLSKEEKSWLKAYYVALESYLKTKQSLHLVEAVKFAGFDPLYYRRREYEKYICNLVTIDGKHPERIEAIPPPILNMGKTKKMDKSVSDIVIIWETIEHWINITAYENNDSIYSMARNHLKTITPTLISERIMPEVKIFEDTLAHVRYRVKARLNVKGTKPFLYYSNPQTFMRLFNSIRSVCKKYKTLRNKRHNLGLLKKEMLEHLKQYLKHLDHDDINFDIGPVDMTCELISNNHKRFCTLCTSNSPSPDKIKEIYYDAKKGKTGFNYNHSSIYY